MKKLLLAAIKLKLLANSQDRNVKAAKLAKTQLQLLMVIDGFKS